VQTYLDLCNAFITELGINGGNPLRTVASRLNSLESIRICSMVADADYEIQSLHHNWKFLWRLYKAQLPANCDVLPSPSYRNVPALTTGTPGLGGNLYQFRKVDRETMVFNYDTPGVLNRPRFMPWRQFEEQFQSQGGKSVSNSPPYWSQSPAGNIIVSTLTDSTVNFQYECWARPIRLASDSDISVLVRAVMNNDTTRNIVPPVLIQQPSSSLTQNILKVPNTAAAGATRLESCRIIIVRAKVMWAEVEGATDIMQAALAEYQDLLEELRADQLPGMEHDRVSENDVPMTVTTE